PCRRSVARRPCWVTPGSGASGGSGSWATGVPGTATSSGGAVGPSRLPVVSVPPPPIVNSTRAAISRLMFPPVPIRSMCPLDSCLMRSRRRVATVHASRGGRIVRDALGVAGRRRTGHEPGRERLVIAAVVVGVDRPHQVRDVRAVGAGELGPGLIDEVDDAR